MNDIEDFNLDVEETEELEVQDEPKGLPNYVPKEEFDALRAEIESLKQARQPVQEEPRQQYAPNQDDPFADDPYGRELANTLEQRLLRQQREAEARQYQMMQSLIAPLAQQRAVDSLSQGLPEVAKEYISKATANLNAEQLANLSSDPFTRDLLMRSARDYAREKEPGNPAFSVADGRPAERVAADDDFESYWRKFGRYEQQQGMTKAQVRKEWRK